MRTGAAGASIEGGGEMSEELDLYGSGINWKKSIAIFATVSLIVGVLGFFGFRWMTTLTPVSRDQALQMFKEESSQAKAEAKASDEKRKKAPGGDKAAEGKQEMKDSGSAGTGSGSGGGGSSPKKHTTTVAAGTESSNSQGHSTKAAKESGYEYPTTPEEGVYSWATDGWEEASGIRRQFPDESQRIITASNGESWKTHHYFSEEREIWSEFQIGKKGAYLASQRNRAKFGPVTNDSTIHFSPPMLVGLANPKVGATWNGSWKDKTSGSYSSRIFDHGTMTIGGETLEVWGYEVRMQMRGELNGTVYAKIMYAPEYALTVQEHYEQDIQTDRGRYQAQWDMTLKSTTPQR